MRETVRLDLVLSAAARLQLRTDPLMDPLRKGPRFQAVERALKFPN